MLTRRIAASGDENARWVAEIHKVINVLGSVHEKFDVKDHTIFKLIDLQLACMAMSGKPHYESGRDACRKL